MSVIAEWADGSTQTYGRLSEAFAGIAQQLRANRGFPVRCEIDGSPVPHADVKEGVVRSMFNVTPRVLP